MADSAADLTARLDQIQRAFDSGVLRVRHGDEDTIFRNLDEMQRVINSLRKRIDAANGVATRPKVNYISQESRGYGGAEDGSVTIPRDVLERGFE